MPQFLQLELSQNELQTVLVALHTLNVVCSTPALDAFRQKAIADANAFYNFGEPIPTFTDDQIGIPSDTVYETYSAAATANGTLKPLDGHYVPIELDLAEYVTNARQS